MIIGLGHKARNGKTITAEYLRLKYNFYIINFADALYEECRNSYQYINVGSRENHLWPVIADDRAVINKQTGKVPIDVPESLVPYLNVIRTGMSEKCAPLLQWWGTDFRRKYFGADYWVNKVRSITQNPEFKDRSWVIGDMRFVNEAEYVKSNDGETWKIDREYIDPDRDPNHPSEIDLDNWNFDRVLKNTGTKGDLFRKIDEQMKSIGGKYGEWA